MRVFIDANIIIYVNVGSTEDVLDFWVKLLTEYEPYTDPLVLDEVIWVSRRKYHVSYRDTVEFLDNEVLPHVIILPITEREYREAAGILVSRNIKPSDALHLAVMRANGITAIATEDSEFDEFGDIRRIWL